MLFIGLNSSSLIQLKSPKQDVKFERLVNVVEKENRQLDYFVTVRSRVKKRFSLSFTMCTDSELNDILQFCDKDQFYYVRLRNLANTTTVFEGLAYIRKPQAENIVKVLDGGKTTDLTIIIRER